MKIYFETIVEAELDTVKEGFNEDLFLALKPWWMPAKLISFGMEQGDLVTLSFPLGQSWISVLTQEDDSSPDYFQFIDEGQKLPFPLTEWKHIHRLEAAASGTKIIDNIEYKATNSLISRLLYPLLWYSFKIRGPIYCKRFMNKT